MLSSPSQPSKNSTPLHWPSLWQLILSVLAALGLLGLVLLLSLSQLMTYVTGNQDLSDPTSSVLMISGMFFTALLVLPSIWFSLRRLLGHSSRPAFLWLKPPNILLLTLLVGLLMPGILLLGQSISSKPNISWWLLPPLQILGVGLPILWLVTIGLYGLPAGSSQRAWGIFDSGLVISPILIIVLEIGALGVLGIFWIVIIATQPEWLVELSILAQRLQFAQDPDYVAKILAPFLVRREVIVTLFLFAAIIVPIIEEILKPIGIWLLVGMNITPAEGFTAGLLSGAGFALFESLGYTSMAGEDWAAMVITRIATACLHIFTSALLGWSYAITWKNGNYLRLGASFLLAVLIHGLWNGLALLAIGATELPFPISLPSFTQRLGTIAAVSLVFLGAAIFASYLLFNWRLRRAIIERPEQGIDSVQVILEG